MTETEAGILWSFHNRGMFWIALCLGRRCEVVSDLSDDVCVGVQCRMTGEIELKDSFLSVSPII